MTPTELRKAAAEVDGYRWVEGTYCGLSWCAEDSRVRLFFLNVELGRWGDWELRETKEKRELDYLQIQRVPDYANDERAALRLVEVMKRKGWKIAIHQGFREDEDGDDWVVSLSPDVGYAARVKSSSLPLAITMAVLKAEGRLNEC